MNVLPVPEFIYPQLRPKQEAVLTAFRRYHVLTALQVKRLFWDGNSLSAAKATLTELRATLQLLNHTQDFVRGGRGAYVYHLSPAGRRYLAGIGYQVEARPHKRLAPSLLHLPHTLAVNDTLIAVELFARRHAHLPLGLMLHERDFKRAGDIVKLTDGTTARVEPDGLFVLGPEGELPVILEVDRGTEETLAAWSSKIERVLAWYHGAYQRRFHTANFTVAVVIHRVVSDVRPARRLATLRAWTAHALGNLNHGHFGTNFFFTSVPPDTTDPDTFLLGRVWYNPIGDAPVSLIPT